MNPRGFAALLSLLVSPALSTGQEVFFDVTPLLGPPINTNPGGVAEPPSSNVLVVPPGTIVPYELGVFVQTTPALPTITGLAAFDVDLLTTMGVLQPSLSTFDSRVLQSFTTSPSFGFPFDDDILGITARQNLAGIVNTGVGLGRRQVLGTGQLVTPAVEGDFQVTATGAAELLDAGINPFAPTVVPATVGVTTPLIIQTRLDADAGDDNSGIGNDEELQGVGAALVNACFPGVAVVVPFCMAGLVGLRWHVRRADHRRV